LERNGVFKTGNDRKARVKSGKMGTPHPQNSKKKPVYDSNEKMQYNANIRNEKRIKRKYCLSGTPSAYRQKNLIHKNW